MNIVHLEPEEFVQKAAVTQNKVCCHCVVLDNGIAGIVYLFKMGKFLYYMDRFMVSHLKEEVARTWNPDELHAEVYRKVALDHRQFQYA